MTVPMQYNVWIEKDGKGVQIDWGNTPKWMDTYREMLDTADRLSLVPKNGVNLPVVSVALGADRRWVLKSTVFVTFFGANPEKTNEIRLYMIGWQSTVNGKNVKSLTWVYPNGTIEVAEEPTFVKHFIAANI